MWVGMGTIFSAGLWFYLRGSESKAVAQKGDGDENLITWSQVEIKNAHALFYYFGETRELHIKDLTGGNNKVVDKKKLILFSKIFFDKALQQESQKTRWLVTIK